MSGKIVDVGNQNLVPLNAGNKIKFVDVPTCVSKRKFKNKIKISEKLEHLSH
jgi:hypothetical protein